MHVHVCRQKRLNHSGVGGGIAFRGVYPARAYTTVVVLVFSCLRVSLCIVMSSSLYGCSLSIYSNLFGKNDGITVSVPLEQLLESKFSYYA